MPKTCACYGCKSRSNKESKTSFHAFPLGDSNLLNQWLINMSWENFQPTVNHFVCSEHFVKEDYLRGIHPRDDDKNVSHKLLCQAVPTVFPAHPQHKQKAHKKRPPPKKRPFPDDSMSQPLAKKTPSEQIATEHCYSTSPDDVEQKLTETKEKLQDAQKKLKVLKKKFKRRDDTATKLLQTVKDQNLITQERLDLMQLNLYVKLYGL